MSWVHEALAIARKEIHINLRFFIQFLFESIASPIRHMIPLLLVYTAILHRTADSPIPGISNETYFPFLLLGTLIHTTWMAGVHAFEVSFIRDKHMRTIDLLFIAPIRVIAIIVGMGLAVLIYHLPTILVFLTAAVAVSPPTILGFFLALLAMAFSFIIALSVGLTFGGAIIATENARPFFTYAISGITLLTPFFYPIDVFSKLPHVFGVLVMGIVRLNPLNAGVTFARAAWFGTPLPWIDFLYLAIAATILLFISAHLFRFTWRTFGIQG